MGRVTPPCHVSTPFLFRFFFLSSRFDDRCERRERARLPSPMRFDNGKRGRGTTALSHAFRQQEEREGARLPSPACFDYRKTLANVPSLSRTGIQMISPPLLHISLPHLPPEMLIVYLYPNPPSPCKFLEMCTLLDNILVAFLYLMVCLSLSLICQVRFIP